MYKQVKEYVIGEYLSKTQSFHDQSRITLLFNIAFSVFILGTTACLVSVVIGTYPILVPGGGNVLFALLALWLLKRENFQLAGKIYFFFLFLLLFGNLNFNEGTMHVGSPFWIVLLNIMVFYILDIRWGITYLTLSTLGFWYFVLFVLEDSLAIMENLPRGTYYSVIYETVFAMFLLGYVINTILKSSRLSDQLLNAQNIELTEQNEMIRASMEEKTIMLKEIHHRVKNNLQVIVSLLRLQMREISDEQALEKFRDTINRVLTMAMIHEKMYQSEELSRINLMKYFDDLSNDLRHSLHTEIRPEVEYLFGVEKIGLKSIVPLALIYNELFSNSLEHAFSLQKEAKISISLTKREDGQFVFTYTDNGNWKDPKGEDSFGLELINALADQLEAEVQFEKAPQTKYAFVFHSLDL